MQRSAWIVVALLVVTLKAVAEEDGREKPRDAASEAPAQKVERGGRTVLQAHEKPVVDLAFTDDGRRLASISVMGEVAVWDLTKWTKRVMSPPGKEQYYYQTPQWPHFVTFTPNGASLVSGSLHQVFVWDVATGKLRATFGGEPPSGYKQGLVLAANGKLAAAFVERAGGGQVVVGAVKTGKQWCTFDDPVQRQQPRRLAFSPDGGTLALSCDTEVRLFDVQAKTELPSIKGLKEGVLDLLFTPDGALLLCCDAGSLSAFAINRKERALPEFKFRQDIGAKSLAFLPDAATLAFIGNKQVSLWDLGTQKVRATLAAGRQLVASRDAKDLVALAPNGGEKIIQADGETGLTINALDVPLAEGQTNAESMLALSPDGALLAVGNRQGEIILFDLRGTKPAGDPQLARFDIDRANAENLEFSPDGKLLAVDAKLFDVDGRKQQAVLEDPSWAKVPFSLRHSLIFSVDGKHVSGVANLANRDFQGGWESRFAVFNVSNGKPLKVGEPVAAMAGSPDGKWVAVNNFKVLELRKTATGEVEQVFGKDDPAAKELTLLRFSPDGALLLAAGNGRVKLWKVPSGEEKPTQAERADPGTTFNGNGTLVVVSGYRSLRLYDVKAGSLRSELLEEELRKAHTQGFIRLAVCESQPLLVTCGSDGEVFLRDLENGKVLGRFIGHTGNVYKAAISRDGRVVATAGVDKTVRLWDVNAVRGKNTK